MNAKQTLILNTIAHLFPEAQCELDYTTPEQLAIAVILSAQTTDIAVNKVTPKIYQKFPTLEALANANTAELESCIHSIGLYHNKAKNIIAFAQQLINQYEGSLPSQFEELCALPGVGRKTANVIQAVAFNIPALAVDTHVHRVAIRLAWVKKSANVDKTERELKKLIPQDRWIEAHHQFLFFGRYLCQAKKPKCEICPLTEYCNYFKQTKK